MPKSLALTLVALMVGLTGCAGESQFMVEAPVGTPRVAPVANAATVVFIRESGFAFAINFAIVDQSSNFLGEAVAKSHFAIQVPPGQYFFVARGGEGTDVVRAQVAAGGMYFIHVSPRMGMWQAGVALDPIKPSESEWSNLPRWLADSHHLLQLTGSPQYAGAAASSGAPSPPSLAAQLWERLPDKAAHTLDASEGTSTPLPAPSPPSSAKNGPRASSPRPGIAAL